MEPDRSATTSVGAARELAEAAWFLLHAAPADLQRCRERVYRLAKAILWPEAPSLWLDAPSDGPGGEA